VLATPEPKIVYGIAYRPQGRRTGEAQPPRRSVVSGNAGMMHACSSAPSIWSSWTGPMSQVCSGDNCGNVYLPTNNEIARSASPIAFVFQILQEW